MRTDQGGMRPMANHKSTARAAVSVIIEFTMATTSVAAAGGEVALITMERLAREFVID